MVMKDIFLLERSVDFYVTGREEVTVNLSLTKSPLSYDTVLKGKVVSFCGSPIECATVKIFSKKYEPLYHEKTNNQGVFCFKNILPPGKYYIAAAAEDYKTSNCYEVVILPKHKITLSIKLCKNKNICAGTVYGLVKDTLGTTISNATVIISDFCNPKKIIAITQSISDGEYLVHGLTPGKYLLYASKNNYKLEHRVPFDLEPDGIINLDLIVKECSCCKFGTISGMIVNKHRPVPRATVALYKVDGIHHTLIRIIHTNLDGVYIFTNVLEGKYLVKANKVNFEIDVENQKR